MKKFINSVENVEEEMVQGLVKAYPQYLKKLEIAMSLCGLRREKKVALVAAAEADMSLLMPVLLAKACLTRLFPVLFTHHRLRMRFMRPFRKFRQRRASCWSSKLIRAMS